MTDGNSGKGSLPGNSGMISLHGNSGMIFLHGNFVRFPVSCPMKSPELYAPGFFQRRHSDSNRG